jgi:hypothetical protein
MSVGCTRTGKKDICCEMMDCNWGFILGSETQLGSFTVIK